MLFFFPWGTIVGIILMIGGVVYAIDVRTYTLSIDDEKLTVKSKITDKTIMFSNIREVEVKLSDAKVNKQPAALILHLDEGEEEIGIFHLDPKDREAVISSVTQKVNSTNS